MATPRLQQQDLFTRSPETQYSASQEHTVRAFNVSTMTTTSFTSGSVDATAVGLYVIPEDGDPRGAARQVLSVAGTTATIDAPWSSSTGVSTIRAWKPADVPVVATGVGSTTTVVSSGHANVASEPDGFWNNYLLLFSGGANAGKAVKVTGFVSSTGTFTFAPAVTSTVVGELALIRQLLRSEGPATVTVDAQAVERALVGSIDGDAPVITTPKGTMAFEMPQKGVSAAAGNAAKATPPFDLGDSLRDILTETLDTGTTVTSVAANQLTVASDVGISVGGFVLTANGQAAQVINKPSANVLTLGTGQCNTASGIAAASTLYASAWYQRKETGYRTCTLDNWRGGLYRQILHGCSPTLTASIERDQLVKFAFNYTAAEALEYDVARPVAQGAVLPIPLIDTTVPYDGKGARFLIDGIPVLVSKLAIDFKLAPQVRPHVGGLCQADGTYMTGSQMVISFTALADNDDRVGFKDITDRLRGNDVISLFYQKGTAAKETFCWAAPTTTLVKGTFNYDNAHGIFDCTVQVVKPQATRGNSFHVSLPAFAMGWL